MVQQNKNRPPISEETRKKLIAKKVQDWQIIDPEGNKFIITDLDKFCRERGLDKGNMHRVSQGKKQHHKGYHCQKLIDVIHPKTKKKIKIPLISDYQYAKEQAELDKLPVFIMDDGLNSEDTYEDIGDKEFNEWFNKG